MTATNNRRKIVLLALIGVLLLTVIPVFAAGGEAIRSFCQSMVEDIFSMDALNSVSTILTEDLTTTYSELWEMTQGLVDNIVTPIAYGIAVIYLVIAFINVGMQPQTATALQFMKPFAWFVAAVILIWLCPEIISNGIAIFGHFAGAIVNYASDSVTIEAYTEAINDYFDTYITSLAKGIVVVGELVFPWLAAKFAGIVIQFMAYGTIIELFVRAIFMPISFGPMVVHGFSPQGTKYLRGFLSCGIRIALMIAVGIIVTYLIVGFLPTSSVSAGEYASDTVKVIFIELAFIFTLKKCGDIANDVVGL